MSDRDQCVSIQREYMLFAAGNCSKLPVLEIVSATHEH